MSFGSQVGSVHRLKQSLSKTGGQGRTSSDTWIRYIPKDNPIVVRFLLEPDGWVVYTEAWDNDKRKSYPVPEGTFVPDDHRTSTRYLAQAVDTETDRVVPLCLPKSLMNQVVARYDKYGTIIDRDYELSKSGTGLETTYMMDPEPPLARKLDKYDLLDLEEVLGGAYNAYSGEGMVTSEEAVPVAPQPVPVAPAPSEDDPITVVPEAEKGDDPTFTREDLNGRPIGELRAIARDRGISPRGMSVDQLIDAITGDDAL